MNKTLLPKHGKNLLPYTFTFWFATELLLNVNLPGIAGVPMGLLGQIQAALTLGLLALQIAFFQEYTRREFWCIIAVSALLGVTMLTSGIRSLFSAWLFIVAAQNTDFDRLARTAWRILLAALCIIAALYLIGVIPDPGYSRNGVLRLSLGFTHPNTFGMRLFQFAACHCYLRRARLRWWDGALLLALAAFAYAVPNSKTATVGILLVFIIMLGIRLKVRLSVRWAVALAACMPVMSIALSWADLARYPALARFDALLSNRFRNVHLVWLRYGATLLGNRIYVTPQERALVGLEQRLWLDNAYGYILLRYGAAALVLFVAGYLYTMVWHGRHRNGVLVCFLLLYALYGVEESYLQMLSYNIFLLAAVPVLYGQRTASGTPPKIYFSLPAIARQIRSRKGGGA